MTTFQCSKGGCYVLANPSCLTTLGSRDQIARANHCWVHSMRWSLSGCLSKRSVQHFLHTNEMSLLWVKLALSGCPKNNKGDSQETSKSKIRSLVENRNTWLQQNTMHFNLTNPANTKDMERLHLHRWQKRNLWLEIWLCLDAHCSWMWVWRMGMAKSVSVNRPRLHPKRFTRGSPRCFRIQRYMALAVHGVVMAGSDRDNSTSKQVSVGNIDQACLSKHRVRNANLGVLGSPMRLLYMPKHGWQTCFSTRAELGQGKCFFAKIKGGGALAGSQRLKAGGLASNNLSCHSRHFRSLHHRWPQG